MCFEIGTLCVNVHVSINHVPLPPEINGGKQLRWLNTVLRVVSGNSRDRLCF